MNNAITWFEIPTTNLDRAAQFYNTILGIQLRRETFMDIPHAIFPSDEDGVGGTLVLNPDYEPSSTGAVIYLDAKGDLAGVLSRIEAAGGQALTPVIPIGPNGHMAFLMDTEGNKIGLHQPQ